MKKYRLAYRIVATALLAFTCLAPAWSEGEKSRPRVYISESHSSELKDGGTPTPTAVVINTFYKGCGESVVTMRKENADYMVILEQEAGVAIEKFVPETSEQDALKKALSERPKQKRADKATLIAAAMAGLSGDPKQTQMILDRKYEQRLAAWRANIASLKLLADQERENNRLRQQQFYAERSRRMNQYHQTKPFAKKHLFVVFRWDGDAIKTGSAKSLGNAVTSACSALVIDWRNKEHRK